MLDGLRIAEVVNVFENNLEASTAHTMWTTMQTE